MSEALEQALTEVLAGAPAGLVTALDTCEDARGASGADVSGGDATVTVEGGAGEPLLLVYGRRGPGGEEFTVTGERAALDVWLAATAL